MDTAKPTTRLMLTLFLTWATQMVLTGSADAKRDPRTVSPRFFFQITEITGKTPETRKTLPLVAKRLETAIDKSPMVIRQPQPNWPDPRKHPEEFGRTLAAHRLRGFRVSVEVLSYQLRVMANPQKPGNLITTKIVLRLFGETLPERVIGFTGDGSGKVTVEVGRKVRSQDKRYATEQAIEVAINDALDMGLEKLNAPK